MDKNLIYTFDKNEMILGGIKASDLVKKYSTPLYTLNEQVVRNRCKLFSNILKRIYPNSIISYASKAFCCKAIYNLISEYNFACDVVSGGEIATVLKSGFDTSKVYFHGNNKTLQEINLALNNNIFNFIVDNLDELETLEEIVNKNKNLENKINVIVRINPGVEAHTHEYVKTSKTDSKFGINLESGEAESFVLRVTKNNKLNFVGLHFHIGSQIFEKESFKIATEKTMQFVAELKNNYNINVKLINAGGGFGVWYCDDDANLTDEDYKGFIGVIADEIKKSVLENNLIEPTLVIEPGRSLIAEAGVTLYTVGNTKEIKDIRKYVSLDGGMYENPRFALYQSKYTAIKANHTTDEKEVVTLVGKCCESGDQLIRDCHIEKLQKGDIVAILTTGAYHYSMASNYNRNPVPPVVLINNGKSKIIVKGQTYDDLLKFDM